MNAMVKKELATLMCTTMFVGTVAIPVDIHAEESRNTYDYMKQYRYHRYVDDKGDVSLCPYYGSYKYDVSDMTLEYTSWTEIPLNVDNGGGSGYVHVHQGSACDEAGCIDASVDTDRYIDSSGEFWFYEETRIIEICTESSTDFETDYVLLVSENGDTNIWNEIGADIFKYSLDVIDEVLSCIPDEEKLETTQKLLENKTLIKVMTDLIVNGEVDVDGLLKEEIESLIEDSGGNSDLTRLLYEYITKNEVFAEDVWYTAIKYTPRLLTAAITGGASEFCVPLNVVLNVYEASTQNFINLGDAIGELIVYELNEKKTADVIANDRYSNFKTHNDGITDMVKALASIDAINGNKEHYNIICTVEELMCSIRDDIIQYIDETLTKSYSFWNLKKARRLKSIRINLNELNLEYVDIYNAVYSRTSGLK